jgi:AbiU2
MAVQSPQTRHLETVRKIAEKALDDAVEITMLISLIEGQNASGINKQLNEAGVPVRAAMVLRNALFARLVILIARAYAEPKTGDLHLRVAADLLKENVTRQIFVSDKGAEKLAAFDKQWAKCRSDYRLPPIKKFRDKYVAHLGEPKDIPQATYRDLFAFGAATAKAMELLALATGVANNNTIRIDDPVLVSSAKAFLGALEEGLKRTIHLANARPLKS